MSHEGGGSREQGEVAASGLPEATLGDFRGLWCWKNSHGPVRELELVTAVGGELDGQLLFVAVMADGLEVGMAFAEDAALALAGALIGATQRPGAGEAVVVAVHDCSGHTGQSCAEWVGREE